MHKLVVKTQHVEVWMRTSTQGAVEVVRSPEELLPVQVRDTVIIDRVGSPVPGPLTLARSFISVLSFVAEQLQVVVDLGSWSPPAPGRGIPFGLIVHIFHGVAIAVEVIVLGSIAIHINVVRVTAGTVNAITCWHIQVHLVNAAKAHD
jgi:hypothetical protein